MLIPKAKLLVVPVQKDSNFRIPENRYRAKIITVNKMSVEKLSGPGEMVKLLFEVQVPSMQSTLNLAKAEFKLDMNSGSELRNVLTRLFGKEAMAEAAASGSFDLERLVGMEVDIEIEHVITSRRDDYEYPLVKIRDIEPAGTLVWTKPCPKKPEEGDGGLTAAK
jgi:hypothetical protein